MDDLTALLKSCENEATLAGALVFVVCVTIVVASPSPRPVVADTQNSYSCLKCIKRYTKDYVFEY